MNAKKLITTLGAALLVGCFTLETIPAKTLVPTEKVIYMPDVTEEMTFDTFWSDRQEDPDTVLMTASEISDRNRAFLSAEGTGMTDIVNLPETVDGITLSAKLSESAKTESDGFIGKKYDSAGNPITEGYFDEMVENCTNPDALEVQPVQYAVAVNRTNLLLFPMDGAICDDPDDPDFDNNFESMIRVNEPLVIRSVSKDKRFYNVYSTHSPCFWIPAEDVAVCKDKAEWLNAWVIEDEDALVVYGDKVVTEDSNFQPETANRLLPMGTVLRLATDAEVAANPMIGNRAGYNNHVVWMPVRNTNGSYKKMLTLISQHAKVSEGFLPLTKANIAKVAFGSLGNEYGWGGMLTSDDCSGYVRDIYKCFGFEMARNTTCQAKQPMKKYVFESSEDPAEQEAIDAEKKAVLDMLPLGSVLFFSGHEMMYLGSVDGKYYVISSTSSIMNPDGSGRQRARSVMLNTLDIKRANGKTWLTSLHTLSVPYMEENAELLPDIKPYKITAEKRSKALYIEAPEGCTVTVTTDSKILKKGKKYVKELSYVSTAKEAKIKVKKALKEGTVFTVQIEKEGFNTRTEVVTV